MMEEGRVETDNLPSAGGREEWEVYLRPGVGIRNSMRDNVVLGGGDFLVDCRLSCSRGSPTRKGSVIDSPRSTGSAEFAAPVRR